MAWTTKTALLALAALCALSAPVVARTFKGTAKANKVVGTKKADRILLRGGNDTARGRGGNDFISGGAGKDRLRGDAGKDRINGGKGNDRVNGGKGKDRLAGGAGNDILNAVDGKKDAAINAGKGRNTCRVDKVEIKIVKGCTKLLIGKAGAGAPGAGGGTGGGGTGGGGTGGGVGGGDTGRSPEDPLALRSGEGLSCGSLLPTCRFSLEGTGADMLVGTVTGKDGVQLAAGAAASVAQDNGDWIAEGLYGCTSNGSLVVDIGSESITVPITCTTP